jgi:hypothetical protein
LGFAQESDRSRIIIPKSTLDQASLAADVLRLTRVTAETTKRNQLRFAIQGDNLLLGSRARLTEARVKAISYQLASTAGLTELAAFEDGSVTYTTPSGAKNYQQGIRVLMETVFGLAPRLGKVVTTKLAVNLPSSEQPWLFGSSQGASTESE